MNWNRLLHWQLFGKTFTIKEVFRTGIQILVIQSSQFTRMKIFESYFKTNLRICWTRQFRIRIISTANFASPSWWLSQRLNSCISSQIDCRQNRRLFSVWPNWQIILKTKIWCILIILYWKLTLSSFVDFALVDSLEFCDQWHRMCST